MAITAGVKHLLIHECQESTETGHLFATRGDERFLIETKWRAKPAGVPDIDDLRRRLETAPSHVIGILVSHAGFTATAVARVEESPNRPILLVDGAELDGLDDRGALHRLLRLKLDHMTVHQRALVRVTAALRRDLHAPKEARRQGRHAFVTSDGKRSSVLEVPGGFSPIAFCQELPDVDWIARGGVGVALDVPIGSTDQHGLLDVFARLEERGWISESGSWRIGQLETSWNGFGLSSLVDALQQWQGRYAGRLMHHSEQLTYLDIAGNGFYALTATLSCHQSRMVSYFNLGFRLPGIPLDTGPLRTLADGLPIDYSPAFRSLSDMAVRRAHLPAALRTQPLKQIALIVGDPALDVAGAEGGEEWVVGAVVANPFKNGNRMKNTLGLEDGELASASDYLLCSLGSWHYLSEERTYVIRFLESAPAGDAVAMRVHLDWADDAPARTRP